MNKLLVLSSGAFCVLSFFPLAYADNISTCAQLQAMSLAGNHVLINDIECAGYNFRPIGPSYSTPFQGTLDGAGYTIRNVVINDSSANQVGLFGVLERAQIRNVNLENFDITGGVFDAGTLAGSAEAHQDSGTHITNVHATGRVSSLSAGAVGGLVGYLAGNSLGLRSTIQNSSTNVRVDSPPNNYGSVGGMLGYAYILAEISDSHASGSVDGGYMVGGLVGSLLESTIVRSFATGTVSNGSLMVGGLVGSVDGYSSVDESYATGDVFIPEFASGGGLVGRLSGAVSNSYATGNVFSYDASGSGAIGGLAGISGNITNSYASGSVIAHLGGTAGGLSGINGSSVTNSYSSGWVFSADTAQAGGLIGRHGSVPVVTNSYWDMQTSGQNLSAGGTGKTTAEMYLQSTYEGWDFGYIWSISNAYTYPWLWYEAN